MSSLLKDVTIQGRATQTMAAASPNDLVRLGEATALLTSLFQGAWNALTTYTAGMMATDAGSLYCANTTTLNQRPSLNSTVWRLLAGGGVSAYLYVGYASDSSGTGFSLTPGDGLIYMAVLNSPSPVASPAAANFAGLWVKTQGPAGSAGASAYLYVGYASDSSGTNFSASPGTGLVYSAFKLSTTAVASPQASDFAGLWRLTGPANYIYLGYASDSSGTGFSLTPSDSLNYIAVLNSATAIASPVVSNFAGLWKRYGAPVVTVDGASALTLAAGVLGLNAASANTASYVVQRDASGNFAANQITAGSVVIGSASLTYATGTLSINQALSVTGLSVTGFSGLLKATAGAVTSGATSNDLAEGTVNLATPSGNAWFTRARVLATPLTGYTTSAGSPTLLATDTILAALGKLDAGLVSGGNYAALAGAAFTGAVTIQPAIATSGSPNLLVLTGAANTTLAGGVESSDLVINSARTVQFNTGTLSLQRAARIEAPTYGFVAASALTAAATLAISGPPAAGTNATITTSCGLKIAGGAAGSGCTNAYGLFVDAPSGAGTNYAARFGGGDVVVNSGWLQADAAYGLKVNGVAVVSNRQTGWTAATGTPTRTSFATSTVTLANLAQAVKALIDDLLAHGLIGA